MSNRIHLLVFLCCCWVAPCCFSQETGQIEDYLTRIIDKSYLAENLIISNTNRLLYLQNLLKDDYKELGNQASADEKNALRARISHIDHTYKQAKTKQKRAAKIVKSIEKTVKKNPDQVMRELDTVTSLYEELMHINDDIESFAASSMLSFEAQTPTVQNDTTPKVIETSPSVEVKDTTQIVSNNTDTTTIITTKQTESQATKKAQYATYTKEQDVLLTPPPFNCDGVHQDSDPFSGQDRKMSEQVELFHYTNSFMAQSLKGQNHITCYASIIEVQKKSFLHLKFVIIDANAQRNFGPIRQDNPIVFKFVNDSKLSAINTLTDEGVMDPSKTIYTVSASFQLNKLEKESFQSLEIDKIRIPWTKGFEEYEVFHVDLIQKLQKCMK